MALDATLGVAGRLPLGGQRRNVGGAGLLDGERPGGLARSALNQRQRRGEAEPVGVGVVVGKAQRGNAVIAVDKGSHQPAPGLPGALALVAKGYLAHHHGAPVGGPTGLEPHARGGCFQLVISDRACHLLDPVDQRSTKDRTATPRFAGVAWG